MKKYQIIGLLLCGIISYIFWQQYDDFHKCDFTRIYMYAIPVIVIHEWVHMITLKNLGGDGKFIWWPLILLSAAVKVEKKVYGIKYHIVVLSAPLIDIFICLFLIYIDAPQDLINMYYMMIAINFFPFPFFDGGKLWFYPLESDEWVRLFSYSPLVTSNNFAWFASVTLLTISSMSPSRIAGMLDQDSLIRWSVTRSWGKL